MLGFSGGYTYYFLSFQYVRLTLFSKYLLHVIVSIISFNIPGITPNVLLSFYLQKL